MNDIIKTGIKHLEMKTTMSKTKIYLVEVMSDNAL